MRIHSAPALLSFGATAGIAAAGESDGPGGVAIPTIEIVATDPSGFEAHQDPAQFTLFLNDPPDSDLTVYYDISGTAVPQTDYTISGANYQTMTGSVTVYAGMRTATIDVAALNDASDDNDKTLVLTLLPDANELYELGGDVYDTVTLYDDEELVASGSGGCSCTPTVSLTNLDLHASEIGQSIARFTVSLSMPVTTPTTVNWTLTGSTATPGDDYYSIGTSATIPANKIAAHVVIIPLDDESAEQFETIKLQITPGSYNMGSVTNATFVLWDEQSGGGNGDMLVDLQIFNGQNAASPVELEDTVGAFTVANLNDSDSDGFQDKIDVGVDRVVAGESQGEPDLMQLVLKKPNPDNGGNVTLKVIQGDVALYHTRTKTLEVALTNGEVSFATSALDRTLWVEARSASANLRDVVIQLLYQGHQDSVTATGVWASKTGFRSSQTITTLAAAPQSPTSRQITVTNPIGFNPGDHIVIYNAQGVPRSKTIDAINGSTFTLTRANGGGLASGDEVRSGPSPDVDNSNVLRTASVTHYGNFGADYVAPATRNGMEMEFTVQPAGVGDVKVGDRSAVIFDISRQRESTEWEFDNGSWNNTGDPITNANWPTQDELPERRLRRPR